MTLLGWRRADEGRALWWRGSRVLLVQISTGLRQTSQWFDGEAAALHALEGASVQWTTVQPPRYFEER
jgi:hypothetical protein